MSMLSPHQFAFIREEQDIAKASCGKTTNCREVSESISGKFGWTAESGTYHGPDVPKHHSLVSHDESDYAHTWVRHPSGAIIDATADQFGDDDPVRVVNFMDARQQWYR